MSQTVTERSPKTPQRLILGTGNAKKCLELRQLLSPFGFDLLSLAEVDAPLEVDETGKTFMENARLKASLQARHLSQWTIGEDSGLCVPYLNDAPGIYSARYSAPDATDAKNNEKLLAELQAARGYQRSAFYISTIALADPSGTIHIEAEGRCWGTIIEEYRGSGGFGYDPLFEVREYHQTFAELGPTVKSVLSHRARALEKFTSKLRSLFAF
jgi:XTP/dITP diphosphohydrolase